MTCYVGSVSVKSVSICDELFAPSVIILAINRQRPKRRSSHVSVLKLVSR